LTDAAPYMKCAAKSLKTSFSKMVHLTYLADGLQRVAETVRIFYSGVDSYYILSYHCLLNQFLQDGGLGWNA
jgi:hypothetical protein